MKDPETSASDQPPTLEAIIEELDKIVQRLEEDSVPLETSIREFESGIALTRKAQTLLVEAEQRMEMLLQETDADDDED